MKFSLRSRVKSFKYAFEGIASMIREEHNSRIHVTVAVFAVILGFILRISISEWIEIIIVIGVVFITELINSAAETISNLIDPEDNPRIKKIKDYTAASVLIAAIVAIITGALIYIPAFFRLMK
jgi:diacylglycerol kinase (ATP)